MVIFKSKKNYYIAAGAHDHMTFLIWMSIPIICVIDNDSSVIMTKQ